MNWKLYLDDIRHPSVSDYVIAKNVKEAKTLILQKGFPTHISFDHDLGLDENGVLLETGYDFAKWIVETDQSGEVIIPEDFTFTVHSANPIGARNITGLITNYLLHKKKLVLQKLNDRLCKLEMLINAQLFARNAKLEKELKNGEMSDYELKLKIDFYMEDEVEPLTSYYEYVSKNRISQMQIGDGKNHNDFYHHTNHEMRGEKHCWLYHSLYDHSYLTTKQMAQIERVWWDIDVSYQYANQGFG